MNFNSVNIQKEVVECLINTNEIKKLEQYLIEIFTFCEIDVATGKPYPFQINKDVVLLLTLIAKYLSKLHIEEQSVVGLTKALYRASRNSVAFSRPSQEIFVESNSFLLATKDIMVALLNNLYNVECITVLHQFLSNLVVNNQRSGLKIWKIFSKNLLDSFKIPEYRHCTAIVLYNLLLQHKDLIDECGDIHETLISNFVKNECDSLYTYDLLVLFMHNERFLSAYSNFGPNEKIAILSLINANALELKDDSFRLFDIKIDRILEEFISKSENVTKFLDNDSNNCAIEIIVLSLKVIAGYSSLEGYTIPYNSLLFDKCVVLLKEIDNLGEKSKNCFSPIKKLSEENVEGKHIKDRPLFGFKANLIQVIGNLCCKNKANQDRLRELDGISAILNCCNIDARNPYITQWAIFAIKNLCEKNMKNQQIIASTKQTSGIDKKSLREMGVIITNSK